MDIGRFGNEPETTMVIFARLGCFANLSVTNCCSLNKYGYCSNIMIRTIWPGPVTIRSVPAKLSNQKSCFAHVVKNQNKEDGGMLLSLWNPLFHSFIFYMLKSNKITQQSVGIYVNLSYTANIDKIANCHDPEKVLCV